MYLKMKNHNSEKLEELASIVLNAENPTLALNELEVSLNSEYSKPILFLKTILEDNKEENIYNKANKNNLRVQQDGSLFSLLISLARTSKQPVKQYLPQYSVLTQSKNKLSTLFKENWAGVAYFAFLLLIYAIVMIIYLNKVLPVFADFFATNGVPLPEFTQQILMNVWFVVLIYALIFIAFVYACILPYWLRQSISRLQIIPKALLLLPTTWSIQQIYYQYLWVVFTKFYLQAGENEPSMVANNHLIQYYKSEYSIKKVVGENQWVLLQTAERHGTLNKYLDKMESSLLNQLATRIKASEATTSLILFLILTYLLVTPVLAMYMPIFQMGNVMK